MGKGKVSAQSASLSFSPVRMRTADVEAVDEDLAVADLAGAGGRDDRVDHLVDEVGVTATSIFSFGRKLTAYSAPR